MTNEPERIGLVLAGGGARGAYEAGVLSVILPALEARGQRPKVIVGTSVGAINAAFAAAAAHLPAAEVMDQAKERWRAVDWKEVVKPIAGPATALSGARYAGAVLGLPGVDLNALLDPSPLRKTLSEWIDWDRLAHNAGSDLLDALAVVATSAMRARSTVFVQRRDADSIEPSHEIDYLETEIGVDHVRASAAIPLAFPAVELDEPRSAAGWYFDGGVRLNTPIKPALDLGVDRVIVIATHAVDPDHEGGWHTEGSPPDFGDGLVQLLFAALVDSLIGDVRMLGKINLLVSDGEAPPAARRYRKRRGRGPLREIPYMFIAPDNRDQIGDIATEIFATHHASPRGAVADPDIAILGRLLGGVSESHGELLSYLMFTPEFTSALIEQGERDAQAWLDRDWGEDGPWLREPIETLADD